MNKVIILFLFASVFVGTSMMAQEIGSRHGRSTNLNVLDTSSVVEVNWKSILNNTVISQIVSSLSSKYSPKIIQASRQGSTYSLKIVYNQLLIQKEDILQVVFKEGVPDPYFIENHNRYYLNNLGDITSDPVK